MKTYRYTYIFLMALFSAIAVSCEVDEVTDAPAADALVHKVFHATIEEDGLTKTMLDETAVDGVRGMLWDPGDVIGIGIQGSTFRKFTNVVAEPTANGVFEGDINEENTYYAIYPWQENKTMTTELTVDIPSRQTYRANSFDINMAPMVGKGNNGESIHFQNLCGILAISMKGTDVIKSISLTAKDAKGNKAFISGQFSVDMGYETFPYPMPTEQSLTNVTIDCGEGVQLDSEKETYFHILLPPGTYYGFQIEVQTAAGGVITKGTENKLVINRSCITKTTPLDFVCPVITISISDIEATSVLVTGATNIGVDSDMCGFVYGTTENLDVDTGNVINCSVDDFSFKITNLTAITLYYVRAFYVTDIGVAYSPLIPFYTKYDGKTTVDLNIEGRTANCYIVPPIDNASFIFDCSVKGHSVEPVGNIASVEVLWETKHTEQSSIKGQILSETVLIDEHVFLRLPPVATKGNALVAVKDSEGIILWSWHVWVTDQPETNHYINDKGSFYVLDRNLGATRADAGKGDEWKESVGTFYQWGRKDPFVLDLFDRSTSIRGVWESITNPTCYASLTSWHFASHWESSHKNDLWKPEEKTIYDPCPVGYRVADNYAYCGMSIAEETDNGYYMSVGGVTDAWFPFVPQVIWCNGYCEDSSGLLVWTSRATMNNSFYRLQIPTEANKTYGESMDNAAMAYPVRCMKE